MSGASDASGELVGLIGDLVGSRLSTDRAGLQRRLGAALDRANLFVSHIEPLTITVGDEFQGTYAAVDAALAATLVVQLELGYDAVRFGVGAGELVVHDSTRAPLGQDGPMWWTARDAIEQVGQPSSARRTAFAAAEPGMATIYGDQAALVNSLLIGRDSMVSNLDEKDRSIALGLIARRTQREIGFELGMTQSAVSQRIARSRIDALVESFELLPTEAR